MRSLIVTALVVLLALLLFDGGTSLQFRLLGMRVPEEALVLGLIIIVIVGFPRRERRFGLNRQEPPPPPPLSRYAPQDEQALRDFSRALESMEHRIESLETILLERKPQVKETAMKL